VFPEWEPQEFRKIRGLKKNPKRIPYFFIEGDIFSRRSGIGQTL
jgi:hypothetical protein